MKQIYVIFFLMLFLAGNVYATQCSDPDGESTSASPSGHVTKGTTVGCNGFLCSPITYTDNCVSTTVLDEYECLPGYPQIAELTLGTPDIYGWTCSGGLFTKKCTETDGGSVPGTQGTTYQGSSSWTDSCTDTTHEYEYYCSGSSVYAQTYTASSGNKCSGGAIVSCGTLTWSPTDGSGQCIGHTVTQTCTNCPSVSPQTIPGTKPNNWAPSPSTVCVGQSFTQTDACGYTQSSTGTKAAICPSASTIACGSSITPTNGCGTCSGTGTMCSAPGVCISGSCSLPVNGVCNNAVLNSCSVGNFVDVSDDANFLKWSCVSTSNPLGTTDNCQMARPTCTSWTYSGWGSCSGGLHTRTVLTSSPSGCIGGTPITSECCASTYTPTLSTFCGTKSVVDNCGASSSQTGTLVCGSGTTCGPANTCVCVPDGTTYTPALNTFCGVKNVVDSCGATVSKAGTKTCGGTETCVANACVPGACTPIPGSYTPALNSFCGTQNVVNNCGTPSAQVGTLVCSPTQVCTNNACVAGIPVPPAVPSGLTVGTITSSSIQINWNAVPGISSYNVYRSLTGLPGSFVKIN